MSVLEIVFKLGGVTSYSADVGTDINSGIQYILRGDVWWGVLTLSFVVLSMFCSAFIMFIMAFKGRVKKWDKGSSILFIVFFPLVPLGTLLWDLALKVKEWWHSDTSDTDSDKKSFTKGAPIVVVAVIASQETTPLPKVTTKTATSSTIKVTVEMPTVVSSNNNDNITTNDGKNNSNICTSNDINSVTNATDDSMSSKNNRTNGNISIIISDIKHESKYNSSSNSTIDDIPIHVQAAASTKLSEALTESVPQACIGMHVVFRTLFVPEVGGTVEWYQWLSLGISICALSYSIVTNEFFKGDPIPAKVAGFFCLIPAIISRLLVCATMGTVHPALFLAPIATEVLAHCLMILVVGKGQCFGAEEIKHICCGARLWTRFSAIVFISNISTCYAIGGYFTTVPQGVTLTSFALNFIYGIIQTGVWAKILSLKMKTIKTSDRIISTGRRTTFGLTGVKRLFGHKGENNEDVQ